MLQKKPAGEIEKFSTMFQEVQKVVDSKQLHPMIRTQYMRTAFQIPFDATVRVSLDTNLTMIKENPDSGPSCAEASRCALWLAWAAVEVPCLLLERAGLSLAAAGQGFPADFLPALLNLM